LPPVPGPLACGYDGIGRLPEISAIYNKIIDLLKNSKRLKGKKILVTAGGTFEAIDGVRGISNRSSGKMGAAIADVCYKEGAAVLLLRARSAVHPTYPIKEQEFENASELSALIKHHIKDFDIVFHTAAVSDYAVESPLTGKLDSVKSLTLKLKPTEKIISKMKEWNPNILLIGFKAVWNLTEKEKIKEGNRKLQSSKADYVVVNDISRTDIGFQNDNNEVVLVARKGEPKNIPKMSKIDLSSKIIDAIIR
jgi:phosphopantothenoylcysteine decarboxylase/phosphopantothenate--cysteine ligase